MDAQGCAALAEFPISSLAAQACPLPNRMTFATGTGLLFCVNAAGLFSSHSNRPPVGGPALSHDKSLAAYRVSAAATRTAARSVKSASAAGVADGSTIAITLLFNSP